MLGVLVLGLKRAVSVMVMLIFVTLLQKREENNFFIVFIGLVTIPEEMVRVRLVTRSGEGVLGIGGVSFIERISVVQIWGQICKG